MGKRFAILNVKKNANAKNPRLKEGVHLLWTPSPSRRQLHLEASLQGSRSRPWTGTRPRKTETTNWRNASLKKTAPLSFQQNAAEPQKSTLEPRSEKLISKSCHSNPKDRKFILGSCQMTWGQNPRKHCWAHTWEVCQAPATHHHKSVMKLSAQETSYTIIQGWNKILPQLKRL